MTDWSLEFDMSRAGLLAGGLLLLLVAAEIRGAAARRGISVQRSRGLALAVVLPLGVVLWVSGHFADRWLAVLAAGLLMYANVRRYAAPAGGAGRRLRGFLIALRTLAMLALLVLLVRPAVTRSSITYTRPIVDVLLDHSRSMGVRGASPPGRMSPRRADLLAAAIKATAKQRAKLSQTCDVRVFGFDETLHKRGDWDVRAGGKTTAIAGALEGLSIEPKNLPVAIVLVSDGRETAATRQAAVEAGTRWGERAVPIYAVGVGEESRSKGAIRIELADMNVPRETTVGGAFAVRAELRADGMVGKEIEIECCDGDVVIDRQTVRPDQVNQVTPLRFDVEAKTAGFHRVEIRALAKGKFAQPRDARAAESRFVLARDDRLNVLLIEAHPRSEAAFIARALAGDARLRLTTMLVSRPVEGAWTNPLPREVPAWLKYHLVIIGDVGRGELGRSVVDSLAEAVSKHGVGLIALGGARQLEVLRSGPLTDLSPTLFEGPRVLRDARMVVTPAGLRHSVMRIVDAESELARAWSGLPAALVATILGAAKPAAEVLAVSRDRSPLLAVMSMGRARTAALGIDSTWRWVMQSDLGRDLHARFWRQLALWTARREPALLIRTDRPQYSIWVASPVSPVVQVEARLVDPLTGKAPEGGRLEAWLEPLAGVVASSPATQPVMLSRQGDRWVGTIRPMATGQYALHAVGRVSQRDAALKADARFDVVSSDPEMDQPEPDFALLRAVAAATAKQGGAFYGLENLGECLDKLAAPTQRRPELVTRRFAMGEQFAPQLLALFCAALIVEWSVRRRCGFV